MLLPRFDSHSSPEFFSGAVEPDEENFPIVGFDPPHYVSDEFIILAFAVHKCEDRVNAFLGGFFKHLSAILVHEFLERGSSELKDGSDEIDRDMIVKELEPGLF